MNSYGFKLDQFHERIRWTNRFLGTALKIFDFLLTFPLLNFSPKVSISRKLSMQDPSIHIHFPDAYLTYRWKGLAMIEYVLNNFDFDFLFITTTSSYIRPDKLMQVASTLPKTNLFAGAKAYEGADFIAGSNRFISRDVLEKLLKMQFPYKPIYIEDVSLSKSMIDLGIEMQFLPHLDISSVAELNKLSDLELLNHYHYRLKSGPMNQRNDVEIMFKLHHRLGTLNG